MTDKEILDYIEDKTINVNDDWFLHATKWDIDVIEKILQEGVKCAVLRKERSRKGYNGKYYVCVSKKTDNPKSTFKSFENLPMFVINDIHPVKAREREKMFSPFIETIIPLRFSSMADEYQAFLKIPSSKIIALGYNLYHKLSSPECKFDVSDLYHVRDLILLLEKLDTDIPIYDFSSNKEINKQKVKSLNKDGFENIRLSK